MQPRGKGTKPPFTQQLICLELMAGTGDCGLWHTTPISPDWAKGDLWDSQSKTQEGPALPLASAFLRSFVHQEKKPTRERSTPATQVSQEQRGTLRCHEGNGSSLQTASFLLCFSRRGKNHPLK